MVVVVVATSGGTVSQSSALQSLPDRCPAPTVMMVAPTSCNRLQSTYAAAHNAYSRSPKSFDSAAVQHTVHYCTHVQLYSYTPYEPDFCSQLPDT